MCHLLQGHTERTINFHYFVIEGSSETASVVMPVVTSRQTDTDQLRKWPTKTVNKWTRVVLQKHFKTKITLADVVRTLVLQLSSNPCQGCPPS